MKIELALLFVALAGPWLVHLPGSPDPFGKPSLFGLYSAAFMLGYLVYATLLLPILFERLSLQRRLRSIMSSIRRVSLYAWFCVVLALLGVNLFFRLAPNAIPNAIAMALPGNGLFLHPGGTSWRLPDPELGFRVPPNSTFQVSPGATMGDLALNGLATPSPQDLTTLDLEPAPEIRMDAHGYRGRSGTGDKTILFVGDSFVHSGHFAAEKTWCGQASAALGAACVNLGMLSYGPQREALVLEQEFDHYRPDLVVLALFEGNDLRDAAEWQAWRNSGMNRFDWQVRDTAWWERSPVLTGLGLAWLKLTNTGNTAAPLPLRPYRGAICGREMVLAFVPPYLLYLGDSPDTVRNHPGWPLTRDAVARCQKQCERRGVPLVVAVLPSKSSIYAWHLLPDLSPEDAMRAMQLPARFTTDDPRHPPYDRDAALAYLREARRWRNAFALVVQDTCEELGVPCLDLRAAFFQAAEAGAPPTYFAFDTHWNAAGHDLAGRTTATFLAARPDLLGSTP